MICFVFTGICVNKEMVLKGLFAKLSSGRNRCGWGYSKRTDGSNYERDHYKWRLNLEKPLINFMYYSVKILLHSISKWNFFLLHLYLLNPSYQIHFLPIKNQLAHSYMHCTCSISGNNSLRRSSSIGLIFSKTSKIHVKYSCFSSIPSLKEHRKITLIMLKQEALLFLRLSISPLLLFLLL